MWWLYRKLYKLNWTASLKKIVTTFRSHWVVDLIKRNKRIEKNKWGKKKVMVEANLRFGTRPYRHRDHRPIWKQQHGQWDRIPWHQHRHCCLRSALANWLNKRRFRLQLLIRGWWRCGEANLHHLLEPKSKLAIGIDHTCKTSQECI